MTVEFPGHGRYVRAKLRVQGVVIADGTVQHQMQRNDLSCGEIWTANWRRIERFEGFGIDQCLCRDCEEWCGFLLGGQPFTRKRERRFSPDTLPRRRDHSHYLRRHQQDLAKSERHTSRGLALYSQSTWACIHAMFRAEPVYQPPPPPLPALLSLARMCLSPSTHLLSTSCVR